MNFLGIARVVRFLERLALFPLSERNVLAQCLERYRARRRQCWQSSLRSRSGRQRTDLFKRH